MYFLLNPSRRTVTTAMYLSPSHKSIFSVILYQRSPWPVTMAHTGDVDYILPLDKIAAKLIELVAGGKAAKNARETEKRSMTSVTGNRLRPSYAAESKAATLTRKK